METGALIFLVLRVQAILRSHSAAEKIPGANINGFKKSRIRDAADLLIILKRKILKLKT